MARKKKDATSRLSARYIDDNILLSATHAWTYLRLPLTSYEYLSYSDREGLCDQITNSLAALITNNQETVEAHLRIAYRPFNVTHWVDSLNARATRYETAPAWKRYLSTMASRVSRMDFEEKEVYLGICLGDRRNVGSSKNNLGASALAEALTPLRDIAKALENFAQYDDMVVSDSEIEYWSDKASDVHRTISQSALHGIPATAEEIAWLISRSLWPNLSEQQNNHDNAGVSKWGPGEITALAEGIATNFHKMVEVEQIDLLGNTQKGYAITLSVSRFPETLSFPEQEPWMHFAAANSFRVDFSTRFEIVPALKVQKDVGKKLAIAKDQAQHIAEAGVAVPLKIREQLATATMLEYTIDKDRMPWAYARHRLIITGSTPEEAISRANTIREQYRELSIDVVWSSGEQFDLLCEAMPGDKVRSKSYYQRQELSILGAAMPTASSIVGDVEAGNPSWRGPYLGYTRNRVKTPVFFSPHIAMIRNLPPGIAITGAPGGGKALALDTPLATPTGWITMGEVQAGDFLVDSCGNPTKVLATTTVLYDRPCYLLTFADGAQVVADENHQWYINRKGILPNEESEAWQVTTKSLFAMRNTDVKLQITSPGNLAVLIDLTNIQSVPPVPVKCVQVDSLDHTYLITKSLIPTHNSFLAFTLAYQMAVQGVWTIYIDPKADAKPMGELKGLGKPKVFDLRHGEPGMLDPFSLSDNPADAKIQALQTINLLLGGVGISDDREEALFNAIKFVGENPDPSLSKVVDYLLASGEKGSRNLGNVLDGLRELPFARLCFEPSKGTQMRPEDGLTIITLLGLELPPVGANPENHSYENKVAVAVMYLITRFARKLMLGMDKDHPKAICIDEAWAITSTPQGARLIPEIARMGRSHNTALVLVSQNAGDLMEQSVTNSLSTKFAFRSTIPSEIEDVMTLFGLEKDQGYQSTVRDLNNGECLMQDADGRVAMIKVDDWDQVLFDTFNTNPETRGKTTGTALESREM